MLLVNLRCFPVSSLALPENKVPHNEPAQRLWKLTYMEVLVSSPAICASGLSMEQTGSAARLTGRMKHGA